MMKDKTILAVGAHPDDIEISCAGTLARYSKMGYKIFVCNVFMGDKATTGEISDEEFLKIREKEARESAAVIGAELIYSIGIRDGELNYINKEILDKFIDVIRYANPDIVITHSPIDYIQDHTNVSQLVFYSTHYCGVVRYKTKNKPIDKSPRLYYMEPVAGIDFNPYEYVDVTETLDIKLEMLSKFKSQINFIEDGSSFHKTDLVDLVKTTAQFRGNQCGVKYAEGFNRFSAWLRNSTERDLP
ncbi:PIG-L family deacetylase [bacterium]|nr:PIG-L family deacetylase [bacterium]